MIREENLSGNVTKTSHRVIEEPQNTDFRPGSDAENVVESKTFLIAETHAGDTDFIVDMLAGGMTEDYSVICVKSFRETIEALQNNDVSALILNLELPDAAGLLSITRLNKFYPRLPIVVLTSSQDSELALKTIKSGAQDYLAKSELNPTLLLRAIRYAMERKQIELELKYALDEAALRNNILEQLSKHDTLTQLPNRSYLHDATEQAIERAKRSKQCFGMLYFDINGFKELNDNFGHEVGDKVLKELARRVQSRLRGTDIIGRLGGDEFVVLSDLLEHGMQAYSLARRINEALERPFQIQNQNLDISVSIGIATYPESSDVGQLLRHADIAMYEVKKNKARIRGHNVGFYTTRLDNKYRRQCELEQELRQAILQETLAVSFQPIINGVSGESYGIEALCRWESKHFGEISPEEFVPIAKSINIINDLTSEVIRHCAGLFYKLHRSAMCCHMFSINVCAQQLTQKGFCQFLADQCNRHKLPLELICLDVTDGNRGTNLSTCKRELDALKALGVRVAIDNFGRSDSYHSQLKNLPVDIIKINQALIRDIQDDEINKAVIAGAIEMTRRLDLEVIAAGVETEEEWRTLESLGCQLFQGYLFSHPIPGDDILAFLES